MTNYASIADVQAIWRPLSNDEAVRCEALLPLVTASLNTEAKKVGINLAEKVEADEDLAIVAKSVTVDVIARTLMTSTDSEPMTQFSESAMGYSVSGSYLVPGGGLFIKKSELARLGLRKQKAGVVSLWGKSKE